MPRPREFASGGGDRGTPDEVTSRWQWRSGAAVEPYVISGRLGGTISSALRRL